MTVDLSKLAFSSEHRYERIVKKGSDTFTVSASSTSNVSISHGLNYTPYVRCFYSFGDGNVFPMFSSPASYNIDGNSFQIDNLYVDNNQINLSFENDSGSSVTITVYYRIYGEAQE
jgi:hypothetical protein